MTRPLVSVCVVTYNHATYISQCLESVIAQQLDGDMEVLVGVDVSTDETAGLVVDLAARYSKIIRPFVHSERQGAAGNVKFLMARAQGEFIAHLDGDDAWLPGKLDAQMELFRRYPGAVAAYCNARVVKAGTEAVEIGRFSDAPAGLVTLEQLMRRGNFLNNSSLVFRACARGALQALPDVYLDFRSHLTLSTLGPLAYTDQALVLYRWSTPESLLSQASDSVRELYWQALESVPDDAVDVASRRAAHADFLRRIAFRSLRAQKLSLWRMWWSRVRARTPGSSTKLAAAVMANMVTEALRQIRGRLVTRSPGRRVFYFHGGR